MRWVNGFGSVLPSGLSPLLPDASADAPGSNNSPASATRYDGALTFETGGSGGDGGCIGGGGDGGVSSCDKTIVLRGVLSSSSFDVEAGREADWIGAGSVERKTIFVRPISI